MRNLLLLGLMISISAHAARVVEDIDSTGTRGGGDETEIEFLDTADSLLSSMQDLKIAQVLKLEASDIQLAPLLDLKGNITVKAVPRTLQLLDREVDAINYPEHKHIDFQKARWISFDRKAKRHMVMHELMGLSRNPETHYEKSKLVLKMIDGIQATPPAAPAGPKWQYNSSAIYSAATRYYGEASAYRVSRQELDGCDDAKLEKVKKAAVDAGMAACKSYASGCELESVIITINGKFTDELFSNDNSRKPKNYGCKAEATIKHR